MKRSLKTAKSWYNQRQKAAFFALAACTLAYLIGSRAIDTGSLMQYAATFLLIMFAMTQVGRALSKGART